MRKGPRIGDVLEISTRRGLAYLQITHTDSLMGFLLRVIRGFFAERPTDLEAVINRPTQFVAFFPVVFALKEGILSNVGNTAVPETERSFPVFRVAGAIDRGGRVLNWSLWDGSSYEDIAELLPEQRTLPIKGVWNDTLLRERIESEYTPASDVR